MKVFDIVNKVVNWARAHKQLRFVADQIEIPTWTKHLADANKKLISQDNFFEQIFEALKKKKMYPDMVKFSECNSLCFILIPKSILKYIQKEV